MTPFLSFKEIFHAYLLKTSIADNEKQMPLLTLLINLISARSTPQILSINGECAFLGWSDILWFLISLPEGFLSNNLQTIASPVF